MALKNKGTDNAGEAIQSGESEQVTRGFFAYQNQCGI